MSLKPFALIAPDACVVTCGYRLHSEIISRSHLLIRHWASQHQKTVALSVGESEYMELAATGHQCAWLRSFSAEIGFPFTQATTICADNQAAIFLAINPAVERRMKHIDIRHHYIREQVETKVIDLYHIAREENPADLFTKPLPVVKVDLLSV